LAAINEDGSVNGVGNGLTAIERNRVITLFGTGPGVISNAPDDGVPPNGPVPTESNPRVIIGGSFADANVEYSGLAPGLVGVWQINVRIPQSTAPGNAVVVAVLMNDIPSTNPQNPTQIRTTIAVR
jgi:uncharacterized protein (TIGR03437 family)